MGCIPIEMLFLVLSFIILIVLIVCFSIERKTKVEFQGFYPFLLILFGCVFFYCLGSIVGFHFEILTPALVSNSSKDIGMAGLSIFAIGGSFLSSNIFSYLEKMNQNQSLPEYVFRALVITDFITWSVIFGIAISFLLVVFVFESMSILIGYTFVLLLLIIILIIYIYNIYIKKIFYINDEDLFNKIFNDLDKDITIYDKYNKSGYFRNYIDDLMSRNIEPNEIMKSNIIRYIDKLNNFASKMKNRIGIYEKSLDYKLFDKYYFDLSRIIISTVDVKNKAFWVMKYVTDIIYLEISTIANTNNFFLEMHAYARLIGTLQSRYKKIKDFVYFNNIEKSFNNTKIHLFEAVLFRSLVSINHDGSILCQQKLITSGLALCQNIVSEIYVNFTNYMYSSSSDKRKPFSEIIDYSRYLNSRLIIRNGSFNLDTKYCLLIYLLGFFVIILHPKDDEAILEDHDKTMYSNIISYYKQFLSGSIDNIIIGLDESLNEIDAKLFNSFYLWDPFNRDNEDVSFKFIAGLIVAIDIRTNENVEDKKKQFKLLIESKMINITINKDNIIKAIQVTINTWVYSYEMKTILNDYLSK
jgi:hypothetical protein